MEETLTTGGIPPLRGGVPSQLKKRKRLNAVLDKISHRSSVTDSNGHRKRDTNTNNNNSKKNNNRSIITTTKTKTTNSNTMFGRSERDVSASQKRELWRENPQKKVDEQESKVRTEPLHISISNKKLNLESSGGGGSESLEESEIDVFSPKRSPHSSPQVSLDSPRICFSPLRIKDSIEEELEDDYRGDDDDERRGSGRGAATSLNVPKFSIRGCESLDSETILPHFVKKSSSRSTSKYIRSISPNPSLQSLSHLPTYLTEIYRRRCLSDTDLSATLEDLIKAKTQQQLHSSRPRFLPGGVQPHHHLSLPIKQGESLESDSQESPLDLSIRSSVSSTTGLSYKSISTSSVDSVSNVNTMSTTTIKSMPPTLRSSLEIVETSGNPDVSYSCPICGQMFSLHDRLAKHMASRHKSSRSSDSTNTKAYACEVCKRSFARSDMLTRHMRLHTGIKPYTCRICGQVFSRSDHLSTHQRTHTGEKPYRCPTCPYAACRRDMITRHMRTHTRYELSESTSAEETHYSSDSLKSSRSISCESDWNQDSKETEAPTTTITTTVTTKPPSPMDTTDKQTLFKVDSNKR
uniref:C2H2-type domain-containing protein n=1 Tax=Lepeophtheirus salmonis TaxID=72036 RepID=A0A0K2UYQ1_LEPSM